MRALLVILAATASSVSAQAPSLPDALTRAADYVAQYRSRVSGVSLEEQLLLTQMNINQAVPRRLTSDVVLVNITERLMGLRDPFAIDTKALREKQPRIVRELSDPTLAAWRRVQEFTRENAFLLASNVAVWYSDPMLALQFIEADRQSSITYKLEGGKRINNAQVIGVGFKEKQADGKKYILGTPSNPSASGRIWVDPATGAIHQTELWIQSGSDVARINVVYAPDPKLNLLLPRQANHTFEEYERGTGMSNMGAGTAGRRATFDASARYSNATYTAIDMTKIIR
ncbi:MAG TPA: hypothetical protein VN700_17730 [Vicinamibacterales bacterium]|nr:hypothetical protein [Vicinamibacterales bacterium]